MYHALTFALFIKEWGCLENRLRLIFISSKHLIHFSFMLTNQNMFIIKLFHRSLTIAISLSHVLLLNAIALLVKVNSTRSIMKRRPTKYTGIVVILGIGTKKQDLFSRKNFSSSVYQYIILKLDRKTEHELR